MKSAARRAALLAFVPLSLVLVGIWSFIGMEIIHERRIVEQAARENAMNLATAFEAHVRSVAQHMDMALLQIRQDYARDPLAFRDQILDIQQVYGNIIAQVAVIDADGRLVFSDLASAASPVDLSDREHFRVHRDNPEVDRLFISRPVLGRISQRWTIQFTRPILRAGSFSGVVVLSVPTEFFSSFYSQIDVGRNGAITLIGNDRAIRARAPHVIPRDNLMALSLPADRPFFVDNTPSGFYSAASAVDGVARLGAFRHLREFGLAVLVLLSPNDYLALHRERSKVLLAVGSAVTFVSVLAGLVVRHLLVRHLQDVAALRIANLKLDQRARTDSLTGALTRGAFLEAAEREFVRSTRYGSAMSILMLDIDHFKSINDTHGHPAGDAVLVALARCCCANLRGTDLFGRVGGEEFAVLLPETTLPAAVQVAEKVRNAIGSAVIKHGAQTVQATASIGVATRCTDDDDLSVLWSRADAALYRAKGAGRNIVMLASHASPSWAAPAGS